VLSPQPSVLDEPAKEGPAKEGPDRRWDAAHFLNT
jgi:hypothetical protein